MEDAAIKTIMAAATENAQAFLSEAESLSLKHIDEFRAGKEDDINVLVAILTQHLPILAPGMAPLPAMSFSVSAEIFRNSAAPSALWVFIGFRYCRIRLRRGRCR